MDAVINDVMRKKTPRCRLNHVEWGAELLVRRSKVEVRSSKLEGRSSKLILTFPIPVASIRHVSAAKKSVIKKYSSAIKKFRCSMVARFFRFQLFVDPRLNCFVFGYRSLYFGLWYSVFDVRTLPAVFCLGCL